LVPFSGKAFHIDDPLFLWTARHLQQQPLDFYGFTVLWETTEAPMSEVTKNPPLAAYYLAAAAAFFGWNEVALHLAFLLPALAAIAGTYVLATRLCSRPLVAALATMLTPVFIVSSTTLMCDTLLLAFWVWAVVCWDLGIGENRARFQWMYWCLAALLVGLASLTKYFGMSLLPLLLVYTLARKAPKRALIALVIPLSMLAAYQIVTESMYGRGLLQDAAGFAQQTRHELRVEGFWKWLIAVEFAGGCLASVAFFLPWLWRSRDLLMGLALMVPVTLGLAQINPLELAPNAVPGKSAFTAGEILHLGLFMLCGLAVLALIVSDLHLRRDASALLLALWAGGTLLFAAHFNWSINGRTILPMAPAVAILLARRLVVTGQLGKTKHVPQKVGASFLSDPSSLALAPSAALALMVAWGDFSLAGAGRDAASQIAGELAGRGGTVWFEGHWGFQYYMEQQGARPVDLLHPKWQTGDFVILPSNNTCVAGIPPRLRWDKVAYVTKNASGWVTTMNREARAGFYADFMGPLPFAFGEIPTEDYLVVKLKDR
jgi:hypothetical protein